MVRVHEDDGVSVTYAELDARTSRLAASIGALRVLSAKKRLVGLIFERSVEMVVAIFGVMKAGGCYMPMEPDFPPGKPSQGSRRRGPE